MLRPQEGGKYMPVSKAQQEATARYELKAYDKILVRLPKGCKAEIQAHAEARGESVNGFLNRAALEAMERDKSVPGATESGPCLHTQEQKVRRILSKHKMHLKKSRKGGGYIVEQEGGSQIFDTFEALVSFADSLYQR